MSKTAKAADKDSALAMACAAINHANWLVAEQSSMLQRFDAEHIDDDYPIRVAFTDAIRRASDVTCNALQAIEDILWPQRRELESEKPQPAMDALDCYKKFRDEHQVEDLIKEIHAL